MGKVASFRSRIMSDSAFVGSTSGPKATQLNLIGLVIVAFPVVGAGGWAVTGEYPEP